MARFGFLFMLWLCAALIAQQQVRAEDSEKPLMLIAAPGLMDPEYRQSVLLAVPAAHGGHIGIILNKPTQHTLASLFPNQEASKKVTEPVFFGGPFSTNALIAAVHSHSSPGPGCVGLMEDVFLAVHVGTIDEIIEQRPNTARYYLGYVAWQPGELREEINRGMWTVREADARVVFRKDVGNLWLELMRASRQVTASLE
ncbi:MAG TPA: YqgE/AlgH family protein [Burkholderiales bacterium]|jgi:putative transcriptional regulator|nr:YqgE/AlgH family protein [Burkholderiales bacterium]